MSTNIGVVSTGTGMYHETIYSAEMIKEELRLIQWQKRYMAERFAIADRFTAGQIDGQTFMRSLRAINILDSK